MPPCPSFAGKRASRKRPGRCRGRSSTGGLPPVRGYSPAPRASPRSGGKTGWPNVSRFAGSGALVSEPRIVHRHIRADDFHISTHFRHTWKPSWSRQYFTIQLIRMAENSWRETRCGVCMGNLREEVTRGRGGGFRVAGLRGSQVDHTPRAHTVTGGRRVARA